MVEEAGAMIIEALEYALTPCPAWARRLGFLTEAVSLRARYRRCHKAWAAHVAECRRLALDAADLCAHHRSVAILGAGLLIEIPLAELARRFERVLLIDAVHPWPTRWRRRRFANVDLVAADLTGVGVELIDALRRRDGAPLPESHPPQLPGAPYDLAISANLLSQLPVLPLDVIERQDRHGRYSIAERERFCRGLIEAHQAWFGAVAEIPCLFSDIVSQVFDRERRGQAESVLHGLEMPPPDRTWTWDIAPHPEQHPLFDRRNTVAGYLRWPNRGPAA